MDNPIQQENSHMDNREFYVRYKINGSEMEARGHRDDVNQHALAFFSVVAPKDKPLQMQLPLPIEKDTPLLDKSNGASEIVSGSNNQSHKPLPTLYREKSPKGQCDQILVIAYFYQVTENREYLSYTDLEAGYEELLRIGAKLPANPRQAVKTAVDKGLMYKPKWQEGKFALTEQGIEFVEAMGARNN